MFHVKHMFPVKSFIWNILRGDFRQKSYSAKHFFVKNYGNVIKISVFWRNDKGFVVFFFALWYDSTMQDSITAWTKDAKLQRNCSRCPGSLIRFVFWLVKCRCAIVLAAHMANAMNCKRFDTDWLKRFCDQRHWRFEFARRIYKAQRLKITAAKRVSQKSI